MARILIVDDDDAFCEGFAETLQDLGHTTLAASNAAAALASLQQSAFDLIFLDFRMPGMDGIALLRGLRGKPDLLHIPIVMLTAYASSDNTIEAMKLGAFDHLTKPIGRDDIRELLARALRPVDTMTPARTAEAPGTLIGGSAAMRKVQKLIGLAAAGNATVLITGETGTGKELVARALHDNSSRAGRPLIALNCAAIPADLLESELFGHVKGSFSGAVGNRPGCFRQADGGTLLLDEIGDMSLATQAKILRALQERVITPVGGNREEAVDVRVIAATHHDLAAGVRVGIFREDLFYRLNVIPIHLPPLRERQSDIAALAAYFLTRAGQPKTLSEGAVRRLECHAWPGNVRELKNAMERVSALVRSSFIEQEDIAFLDPISETPVAADAEAMSSDLPGAVARLEATLIRNALIESGGNRAEAARRLGIHRQLFYAKLKEYGLDRP